MTLAGFKPKTLPDGSWGARFTGDTSSLPAELVGLRITVSPRSGKTWTSTILEVLEHDSDHVLVRHSGKPK